MPPWGADPGAGGIPIGAVTWAAGARTTGEWFRIREALWLGGERAPYCTVRRLRLASVGWLCWLRECVVLVQVAAWRRSGMRVAELDAPVLGCLKKARIRVMMPAQRGAYSAWPRCLG